MDGYQRQLAGGILHRAKGVTGSLGTNCTKNSGKEGAGGTGEEKRWLT